MNHQIGDNNYLRRLSDFLLARDQKVLPDNVDTQNWIPVIPYDTKLNTPDLFEVRAEGNQDYISSNVYNLTVGSDTFASDPDIVLPAGYIYKLISLQIDIDIGTPVTSGDHITIDIIENHDRWPITHPGGTLTAVTDHYRKKDTFFQQNPFRLSSGTELYSFNWPSGNYMNYASLLNSYSYNPKVEIICPDNSKFGTNLQFILTKFNNSHAASNWNAAAIVNTYFLFERVPLHGLTVGGILDIVPP
jgi:hypothetical protein